MPKMMDKIMDIFNDPEALKVLATVSSGDDKLNNVPVMSMYAPDDETIAFGDIFLNKTKENLLATKKASVVGVKLSEKPGIVPNGFQVKGTFQEFQTSGPIFDKINEMAKKSIGKEIKAAGIIKVDEGYTVTPMSYMGRMF